MKTNVKRFLKWNPRQSDGFTLVELIVVIAILAILAAVAVPAYSGYIEKANRAADEQLLAAVNKAFASACVMNGDDIYLVKNVQNIILTDGKITENAVSPYGADFWEFYKENKDLAFKTVTSLSFNEDLGAFELAGSGVGGMYASLIESIRNTYGDEIAALAASTFGSTMGMEALMGQLDQVVWIATGMTDMEAMRQIFISEDFEKSAMQALGMGADGDALELLDKLEDMKAELVGKYEGMTPELAEDRIYANAAVLYTAQLTAGMSETEAKKLFEDATKGDILAKMSAGNGEGLAQAALVCGMYTAYSKQPGTTVPGEVNVQNVLNALENDDGFNNYLQSEQGKKDLNGYLSSLQILNSATQGNNVAEVENLMVNGFADQDLIAGLGSLIGN